MPAGRSLSVNGRDYRWPESPLVVVCIDGNERGYIDEAVAAGFMPWTGNVLQTGGDLDTLSVVPSFTNPNNLSIVTGQPPSVHGICGNFFYDREADREVMMNDPKLLRSGTILAAFQEAGAKIAVVTAKDKLRKLLGYGLKHGSDGAVCFSAERCNETTMADHGIDNAQAFLECALPDVYSAALSEVVFLAGVKLMKSMRPDILYLSTTDYIQHKFAPGDQTANEFYQMMDRYWAELDALGATVVLTADHGMNSMHKADGSPNVLYLQPLLDDLLGNNEARVICPITDPYVVHHGALGGFVTAYLPRDADVAGICQNLNSVEGIEWAAPRAEACARFELPEDRTGDIIVVSARNWAIGSSPDKHDLSGLEVPLRSHGGLSTQAIPMIVNRRIVGLEGRKQLRNFDAFSIGLNHVAQEIQSAAG